MNSDAILIAGPLVRAASWEPTAEKLRDLGWRVQVPDVLAHHSSPPAWSAWSHSLISLIAPAGNYVLIGHSSASALTADLATKLPTKAVVIVDGDVPPTEGTAYPVRPELRDFIQNLAGEDGYLPVWSQWFDGDAKRASKVGIDVLKKDSEAFAQFEGALPKMPIDWFDESVELTRWDHIPAGYIQNSPLHNHSAAEARRRGWPVINTEGTHLDPTLRPAETANAIAAITRTLDAM
ncbi:MAG: alpha/beta hydrolase [Proteobacteria bacterium]|nr:alpha/beta hydrolase [Pseudomonadota bacterium]